MPGYFLPKKNDCSSSHVIRKIRILLCHSSPEVFKDLWDMSHGSVDWKFLRT